MDSRWYDVEGRHMHVRESGSEGGPIMVLVHGFVMSSRYMVPSAHARAPNCRVYAPDLSGFGLSSSEEILDTRQLGTALASWLEIADLNDVTLVCNSYGCQIAAEAVIADSARIAQLIFIGP